jgi:HAD superfamily hydrolase (TIGR01509 family)
VTGPPALVLFDCDGVLVDSERLMARVDAEVFGRMGWPLTEAEIVERFMGRTHAFVTEELGRRLGRALPPEWDEEFRPLYLAALEADLRPVDGIVEALDRITLPTCIASSGSHRKMRLTLGKTGLLARFEGRIFSGEDVARGKPAPDLFLHAARSMGADPSTCVVVEDSPPGLEAARAAGMRSLAYAGGLVPAERLAGPGTTVFHDMRLLPGLLAGEVS